MAIYHDKKIVTSQNPIFIVSCSSGPIGERIQKAIIHPVQEGTAWILNFIITLRTFLQERLD